MSRTHNFCAGPSALPGEVLTRVKEELMDWSGVGASVMEISHRSREFLDLLQRTETTLRRLISIPNDYAVLFLHGGASMQFAAVPMNLCAPGERVDHLVTGQWSKKASAEGARFADVNIATGSSEIGFTKIPEVTGWRLCSDAAYLHYCPNETIDGLEFGFVPEAEVPLVADMSSTILSRPFDISRFGVVYAGAQKNIGPAGLCIVIVRRDLLGRARDSTPAMLNWQIAEDKNSMFNTPPTFAIYVAGLVFDWLESKGGLSQMEVVNRRKASKLYKLIDQSDFYKNPIDVQSRSLMNVPFKLVDPQLDSAFLEESKKVGLLNLKGHRSVGGMRASLYNAVDESSVDALCSFMQDFERLYG